MLQVTGINKNNNDCLKKSNLSSPSQMSHNFLHQVAGNRCHTNKFTRTTQNSEIGDSHIPLSGDVTEVEAGDFLFRLRATLLEGLITASSALLS